MSEKRFHQFGLWIIDDPNSNVNSIADLIDTKLMSTNEVVDLLNEQQSTISALNEENEQLKEYCIVLKSQIKRMGELGGFNKHMIKTILESDYDE